jgi:hypothetical protein
MSTSFTEATFLEPTYRRVPTIWWALLWRSVLWPVGPGVAVAVIEAFIEARIGIPDAVIRYLPFASGVVVGLLVELLVIRSVLRKKYRGFSIRLVAA